jgi:LmbE family N-acetylglucosaminyl deacetylase
MVLMYNDSRPPAAQPPGVSAPLLVLSPHLDDAVISCGGLIAAARSAGRRVKVVTFFTRSPGATVPLHLRVFARYEVRRAEDERALRLLGAEAEHLDFMERIFRDPPLRGVGSVFKALPNSSENLPNLPAMIEAIQGLKARNPDAVILAPLGVGKHIDHVEVFLAALQVLLDDLPANRLWFYEDAYALLPFARQQHFVTRRLAWPPLAFSVHRSLRVLLLESLFTWSTSGPTLESLLPPKAHELEWSVEPVMIVPYEERKLAAVRAYSSQVSALGGDGWLRVLRDYHRRWGGAEPLWQCVPKEELT